MQLLWAPTHNLGLKGSKFLPFPRTPCIHLHLHLIGPKYANYMNCGIHVILAENKVDKSEIQIFQIFRKKGPNLTLFNSYPF